MRNVFPHLIWAVTLLLCFAGVIYIQYLNATAAQHACVLTMD